MTAKGQKPLSQRDRERFDAMMWDQMAPEGDPREFDVREPRQPPPPTKVPMVRHPTLMPRGGNPFDPLPPPPRGGVPGRTNFPYEKLEDDTGSTYEGGFGDAPDQEEPKVDEQTLLDMLGSGTREEHIGGPGDPDYILRRYLFPEAFKPRRT